MKKSITGAIPNRTPPIIITGCGRSGTLYITKFWKVFGLSIGHEKYKKDGIASWYLPIENRLNQIKAEIGLPNALIFHQVRHPLKVISSMFPRQWTEPIVAEMSDVRKPNKESKLLQTMKYWYWWNIAIEITFPIALRYRIEDIQKRELIERLTRMVGVNRKGKIAEIKKISTKTHTSYGQTHTSKGYKHIFTWDELEKEDSDMCWMIWQKAKNYGYY
ncbi:MAG: hypothetical protein SVK08_11595 [Halobacteriota archaeon]|nr:hypothetical protein [Halobacteriota archaeon]